MPALNFKKQFAVLVESGKKKQTIRELRADGRNPKPGQTLFLYTGMRTKSCKKLGEAVCSQAWPIYIDKHDNGCVDIFVSGNQLSQDEIDKLSFADGFDNADDFVSFFSKRIPFSGYLIKW